MFGNILYIIYHKWAIIPQLPQVVNELLKYHSKVSLRFFKNPIALSNASSISSLEPN